MPGSFHRPRHLLDSGLCFISSRGLVMRAQSVMLDRLAHPTTNRRQNP